MREIEHLKFYTELVQGLIVCSKESAVGIIIFYCLSYWLIVKSVAEYHKWNSDKAGESVIRKGLKYLFLIVKTIGIGPDLIYLVIQT